MEIVDGGPVGFAHLAGAAARLGCRTAVVVADEAVVGNGYVDRVLAALTGRSGTPLHVVPPGEPTEVSVDAAAAAVRQAGDALVVAVGGGTALDTAKLAAAIAGANRGVEHYLLNTHRLPSGRPVVAIPSTAGTGSEVTRTCVLTDRDGRKAWVWGDALLPELVVLDPLATRSMPPHITATTGLDAFVHAVEALTGSRSATFEHESGRRAIRLVLEHLPRAVAQGDDLDARRGMQQAAMLAGVAIDHGGTGIAHSIGHALGALAHVPHGAAVAVGLAAALEWNVEGAPDAFASVAGAMRTPVGDLNGRYTELLVACRFADVVRRIGPLALTADDVAATMIAAENRPMYDNNCRRADDAARHTLAERALGAWADLARCA